MSTPATHAAVAIVGGGIVGVATAYHLAKAGRQDVLLLERSELTAGSTWHAAGNLPHFHGSFAVMRLQQYGKALYRGLAAEAGQAVDLSWTGALRLAHTADRADEFERVAAFARTLGIDMRVITPAQAAELFPGLVTEGLVAALWDPVDGHADPTSITNALAVVARRLGARIERQRPVLAIEQQSSGAWKLHTERGDVIALKLVIAAGFRSPEVAAMLGVTLPIANMEHQYLVTDALPELLARDTMVPMLRDPDTSYYLRQERKGLIIGPYEHTSRAWATDGVPAGFGQELLPPDLDRIADIVQAAMERVPWAADAGIKTIVNGPITYTPDGLPLIGPIAGLDNVFLNTGSSFGIVQGAGSGKVCADWLLHGEPEWDSFELDPRRFDHRTMTRERTLAKCIELYDHEYDASPPYAFEMRPAARPMKTTPATARHVHDGAAMVQRFGWERPAWFGRVEPRDATSFRRGAWFDAVRAEARAVHEHAGVLDLSPFSKWQLSGPRAQDTLDRLGANRAPRRKGGIALTHALTDHGGVRSEFTVTRTGDESFYVVSAAAARWHDADLLRAALPHHELRQKLPRDGSTTLDDVTDALGCIVLAGPKARDVLSRLTRADLSNAVFPWLTAQRISVAGIDLLALRVNVVGELGWELHHPIERQLELYDALRSVGAEPFGLRAMDSLRLEKMYRNWRSDLTTEATLVEAGMQRFAKLDDDRAFRGRATLEAQLESGPHGAPRTMVLLEVAAAGADCIGSEPVWAGTRRVGMTTSGGYGFRTGMSLALAYVHRDVALDGVLLDVELMGQRLPARVHTRAVHDPDNLRLRG